MTVAARSNFVKFGDTFLSAVAKSDRQDLAALWGTSWVALSEDASTEYEVYEHFATFVTEHIIDDGKKNEGENFKVKTAHNMWRGLLNERRNKFSKSSNQKTKVSAIVQRAPFPARPPAPPCCTLTGAAGAEKNSSYSGNLNVKEKTARR